MNDYSAKNAKVGDWVGFKSDIEQYGKIVEIKKHDWLGIIFVLENPDGFQGEYIRGLKRTEEDADRCWKD